jgi:alpha-1,3-mannosyltransferase
MNAPAPALQRAHDRSPSATLPERAMSRRDRRARRIGDIDIRVATRAEAIDDVLGAIAAGGVRLFAFCNAHTVNMARRVPALALALSKATVFNDGVGVNLASKIVHGRGFPANLNGTDLVPDILASLRQPTSVFLVGSLPEVVAQAVEILPRRFPNVVVAGVQHGYFDPAQDAEIVSRIRQSGAQLVLVAMGHPRQELWAAQHLNQMGAVVLCVGALLDFMSGRVRRAPKIVRALRLEWLFRLALEPRRLAGRYLGGALPLARTVIQQRLGHERSS